MAHGISGGSLRGVEVEGWCLSWRGWARSVRKPHLREKPTQLPLTVASRRGDWAPRGWNRFTVQTALLLIDTPIPDAGHGTHSTPPADGQQGSTRPSDVVQLSRVG